MYSNVPLTVKLPEIIALPPTFKFLPMPTPPVTTTAPILVDVDSVALVNVVKPLLVNVVNAPVLGVALPTGELFKLPPLITALPELKLVATEVVEDKLVMPVKLPPVICALPDAKFVNVPYTAPMLATALI